MIDIQTAASLTLLEKFDNQLRDILSADIRAVNYTKNQLFDQFYFKNGDDPLIFAS